MKTGIHAACVILLAAVVGMPLAGTSVRAADEQKCLRSELEQMLQSVSDRVQAAADKLDLTAEQRSKIREIGARHTQEREALRAERKSLLQDELKALAATLTPEQRDQIKELAEDRIEQAKAAAPGLPRFSAARDTLAERIESTAEKLGLTSEQRKKILETLSSHADRHAALRAKCREAAEGEFKEIAAVLNPEQRQKAREYIEERLVIAAAAKSVKDRLDAAADKLGLSADQRQQIAQIHSRFAGKYRALRSERRELMEQELKAISTILTPEQRETVKDFCEDRVVILEGSVSGREPLEAAKGLKETVTERLEALADKLGLSGDQRTEIRGIRDRFSDQFQSQREQRKALRQEELQALREVLTPEQREKVRDFVEDRSDDQ